MRRGASTHRSTVCMQNILTSVQTAPNIDNINCDNNAVGADATAACPNKVTLDVRGIALSRKRDAAKYLSKIPLEFDNSAGDAVSALDCRDQPQATGDESDPKKSRPSVTVVNNNDSQFTLTEYGDSQTKTSCEYADRSSNKVLRCCPEVGSAIVEGYKLVGVGKELTAFHLEKKTVKYCQQIDSVQYKKLLLVRERLNKAKKFWKHDDVDAMREFVLPSSTEFCTDERGQCFVMSSWHYGTLHSKVEPGKSKLTEYEAFFIYKQIVRCMAFCHACGIVMRDFKLRKFVFIDKEIKQLRLRDVFDLHVCEEIDDDRIRDRHCCPAYVAPELLKDSNEYAGRPADIWALGVLLYILLFGSYPFNDTTPQRLFHRILKARFCIPTQATVSHAARALVYGMLKKKPQERPTAEQLLSAPWLDGIRTSPSCSLIHERLGQMNNLMSNTTSTSNSQVQIASALNATNRALELARQIIKVGQEDDDQVVPSVRPTVVGTQRKVLDLRDIISTRISIVNNGDINSSGGI